MEVDLLIHPGEILLEEYIKPYGLSANRLAMALGLPTNRITSIIKGTRGISGQSAILLGHAFGTSSQFWLNLQSRYDLDMANQQILPDMIRRADEFARHLPV